MVYRIALVSLLVFICCVPYGAAQPVHAAPLLVSDITGEEYVLSWSPVDEAGLTGFVLHSINATGSPQETILPSETRQVFIAWGTDAVLFWVGATFNDGQSSTSNFIWGAMQYPRCPPLSIVQIQTNPPDVFIGWSCIDDPPIPPI